jgi:hypothetical protein
MNEPAFNVNEYMLYGMFRKSNIVVRVYESGRPGGFNCIVLPLADLLASRKTPRAREWCDEKSTAVGRSVVQELQYLVGFKMEVE